MASDELPRSIDYDRVSRVYDNLRSGNPEIVSEILAGAGLAPRSLVLDVGCGTANNTLLLAQASDCTTVGVDLSMGMLLQAIGKSRALQFVHAPAEVLPFRSDIFALVFMTEVIHHLPDMDSAVASLIQVMRPDGWVSIVTQSHHQIDQRVTSRFFPASAAVDKQRYPDIAEVEATLRRHGFVEVHATECNLRPVRLGSEYLKTVENRGYSMLHKIGEEDYQRGVLALRKILETGEKIDYTAGYTFVWGKKPSV
jgi:ubiquinone/menaquinone biosynthesis C-methylase UbiE